MRVFDPNSPNFFSEAKLTINMLRNMGSPTFTQDLYTATVTTNTPPYTNLVNITAPDADGVRVT